jgi:hypothetical protein
MQRPLICKDFKVISTTLKINKDKAILSVDCGGP